MARSSDFPSLSFLPGVCAALLAASSLQAALPVVSVSNNAVATFSYDAGSPTPDPQMLVLSADQPARLLSTTTTYLGQPGVNWLTVFPPNGALPMNMPATLTLYATPTGLMPGNYVAQVTFATVDPVDPGSANSFTVIFTVTGPGSGTNYTETMTVSPASLAFTFNPGGTLPGPQSLSVATSDNASVTASVTTNDGNPWLLITPNTLTTPATINVSVNPATLTTGAYNGTITITAPNTVTQVPVMLTVGSVGLTSAPSALVISEPQNYGVSAYQYVTIGSAITLPLAVSTAADTANWLQVDTNTGMTPATIGVRANDAGLEQGTYTGTVTVQAGPAYQLQIPVTLTVGIPAPVQLLPSSLTFAWRINDPLPAAQSVKINSLTGSPVAFSTTSTTSDGASWLSAIATPATAPGILAVSVNPAGLSPGTYSGLATITPGIANASPQPVVVTLLVQPAPAPTVLSVTNAASYQSGKVAPGEIVAIFGSTLGPAALTAAPPGTAPTTLANTSVTFDGIPAPVYYTSSTQTSVQVPYNIASGKTVLKVTYNGATSAAATLTSLPTSPGLFTSDSSGQRQLAALNRDLSVNSPSNPAARGSALVLYGTGEGQTAPPSVEGARVSAVPPFPQTLFPVIVSVGGVNAPVQYAGETPGLLSGLFQINVTVPPDAPTGAAVPVIVSINGQTTQAGATVAIK